MIQNKGVCPIEGFTTLGLSVTRSLKSDRLIGQFGTGNKMGTLVLMRHNIKPVIYLGLLRLEFFTRTKNMEDELNPLQYRRVFCSASGKTNGKTINRKMDLNMSLDHGELDWRSPKMGLREYISNALDFSERLSGDIKTVLKNGDMKVDVVSENQVRAKDGYTRIFVPLVAEVEEFYADLPKWFLHFNEPHLLDKTLLPRRGRAFSSHQPPMIYRRGVLVQQVDTLTPSVFDYNINNLKVDECRNAQSYDIRDAAAKALRNGTSDEIAEVFRIAFTDKNLWEFSFSSDGLSGKYDYETDGVKETRKETWKAAWEKVAANTVLCADDNKKLTEHACDILKRKGKQVKKLNRNASQLVDAATDNDLPTIINVLERDEQEGITAFPVTDNVQWAFDVVWRLFIDHAEELNIRNVRKPELCCFSKVMEAEAQTWAYYRDNKIGIHRDIASGRSRLLLKAMLEEVVHHLTKAGDTSRDLQDYCFRLLCELMVERYDIELVSTHAP